MKEDILIYLFQNDGASAGTIAQETGHHPRQVQELLITMDDDGDVLMKNGIYRISEAARLRALKRFDDRSI